MSTLSELLLDLPEARLLHGDPATPIVGICHDTRLIRPGELFVAIPGFHVNGFDLIPEALARGASAVVAEALPAPRTPIPVVLVPSARAALADLAAAFHGHPSRRLAVVGITGTDGKTSTAHLLSAILEAQGLHTGWISTVNTKVGTRIRANATDQTTPESPVLQAALAEMAGAAVDVAIIETSSHALELERVRSIDFRVGVFTNLSREHINFHGTFEAYRTAKARLFAALPANGLAVLNAADPESVMMQAITRAPVVTYALEQRADVRAGEVAVSPAGTAFTVHVTPGPHLGEAAAHGAPLALFTRLVGGFNVANWLAAYAAAAHFGATLDDLYRAVERQMPVPGRMNFLQEGQPFLVVVDFAHTPQGLAQALSTLRRLSSGRLLLMFGLPGGRDNENRFLMGKLAAEKSDFFVITTDDPYDESPYEIARRIAQGAASAGAREGEHFAVDLDRRSALRALLRRALPGDALLMAGHGHLDHLVIGAQKLRWNDAAMAAEELRALGYGSSSAEV